MTILDTHERIPTGEFRQTKIPPGEAERLAKLGINPTDFIPGYRVTYRELANICQTARDNGWSGFIGLDEAFETGFERPELGDVDIS